MLRRNFQQSRCNLMMRNLFSTTANITTTTATTISICNKRQFSLPGQQPTKSTSVKNFSPAERREQMRRQKEEREREIKVKVDNYKKTFHPNAREMFFGLLAISGIFFSLFIGGGCMLPKSSGFFEDPGDRGNSY